MRFFFLSVVALCLDGVVGAIILLPRIHQFELIPAGNTSSSETPAGKITSVDPLAGVIYLEKSKEIESVYVELFSSYKYSNDPALCTGSPFLNATAGVLTNVTDKYTRTKSDSIIQSVEFRSKSNSTDGNNNFCVRTSLKANIPESEVVAFFDTAFVLNVNFGAGFENFNQSVNTVALTGNKESGKIDRVVGVGMNAYLCGEGAETVYRIGQDFEICVETASSLYNISSFKNVICKNSSLKRVLVDSYGTNDMLTSIKDAEGTKSNDNTTTAGKGSKKIISVVTAGYFSNKATSFSCTGDAEVVAFPPPPPPPPGPGPGRSLTTSFSFASFGQESSSRDLQESTLPDSSNELGEIPFSTTVGISAERADFKAAAFFAGYVGLGNSFIAGAAMIMIAAI